MLDINIIRGFPNKIKEGAKKKRVNVNIGGILEKDRVLRKFRKEFEDLKSELNKISKSKPDKKTMEKARSLKSDIKEKEEKMADMSKELNDLLMLIPNLPLKEVPVGKNEEDNVVLKKIGEKPKFDFRIKDYLALAEKLDLIDIKRAAKIAGSRFGFIKKEAVLLEFALISFAMEKLTKAGFIPVVPPVMLKSEIARGMGYFEQADANEAYYIPKDDLYLAGTAEQPLGTMHTNEVFNMKDLPRRYVGFSTCFRREAGSYGKDTKGIFRVHQFDKVEMFSYCRPEESKKEHLFLLGLEKDLINDLKIPYQVVQICTGELGFPAAAKYDIEVWMPSENRYRETHSTSNCTDFQARRLNIRYKKEGRQLDFVHTLNGTAFAVGRILIAIIENYQQKDGSVIVPEVLQKYLNFRVINRAHK